MGVFAKQDKPRDHSESCVILEPAQNGTRIKPAAQTSAGSFPGLAAGSRALGASKEFDPTLSAPSLRLHSILHLQRAIGNRAVRQMLQRDGAFGGPDASEINSSADLARSMQASLAINAPGGRYEQEADRVADQVKRMDQDSCSAAPAQLSIDRKCAECEEEEKKPPAKQLGSAALQSIGFQSIEGNDDEYEARVQPPTSAQGSAPAIQRVATWGAGTVHQTNNLADSVVNGPPVGVTWPTLNGTIFWGTANARAALVRPTLSFASASSGGVNASVATVPTNTASFDETVLSAGPWTIGVPKTTIGGMFSTLTTCTGAGNSTFRAIGNPADEHMFTANRRHEDHHAADHRAAFNRSVVPWDNKLTAAASAGTTFNGATRADAEAALHAAMGGTPDQIADAFANACEAAVIAFHATPAGGPVQAPTDPSANADCSNSSAKYHNPS